MSKTSLRTPVIATVWRHWKPTFVKNGWAIFFTFLFYSGGAYLELMLKPTQYKHVFDELAAHHNPLPTFYGIILIGCAIWILHRSGEYFIVISETRVIRELKDYALRGLMGKNTHFFTTHPSGGLVAKVKRFAGVSETVIDQFVFSIVRSVLLVVYLVIFTAYTIPKLSLIFTIWIIVFTSVTIWISRIRMRHDLASSTADSTTTGRLSDILLSLTTLRIFARPPQEFRSFKAVTLHEQRLRRVSWFLGNLQWAVQGMFMLLLEIVCMYYILTKVHEGTETIGTAVMVQAYIASLAMYMWGFGQSLIKVRVSFADAYEMSALLDHASDEPITEPVAPPRANGNAIVLEGVSFSYNKSGPAVSELNYSFHGGKRYGVVGTSGSGKTTLTKLILRLYENQIGTICVGGCNIAHLDKHTIRSWISYVPQQPTFPSRTVREIIALGKDDATDSQILDAADKASCTFVHTLPHGLDTHVGERGVKLSGGECQRLAIAAAILKDAPIVIMDEPTSALDAETERVIQESIKSHFHGKTLIVVAHRLSTVAILDEVILMKDGRIVESAPHTELLDISSEYHNMWQLQTNPQIFA